MEHYLSGIAEVSGRWLENINTTSFSSFHPALRAQFRIGCNHCFTIELQAPRQFT